MGLEMAVHPKHSLALPSIVGSVTELLRLASAAHKMSWNGTLAVAAKPLIVGPKAQCGICRSLRMVQSIFHAQTFRAIDVRIMEERHGLVSWSRKPQLRPGDSLWVVYRG